MKSILFGLIALAGVIFTTGASAQGPYDNGAMFSQAPASYPYGYQNQYGAQRYSQQHARQFANRGHRVMTRRIVTRRVVSGPVQSAAAIPAPPPSRPRTWEATGNQCRFSERGERKPYPCAQGMCVCINE